MKLHLPKENTVKKWSYMFEVSEWHKLNNVTEDRLSLGRSEDPIVAVQHLHVTKIGISNSNNDD